MKFYFSQASKINQTMKAEDINRNALLVDLEKTKQALEVAYMRFDNVTEPDMIDCYIYELNSVLKRYDYLLEEIGKLHPVTESLTKPAEKPVSLLDTEAPVSAVVS